MTSLVTFSEGGRLVLIFQGDATAPVRCALELWEVLRELPSMSVRMAVHSGPVSVEADIAVGEGMDEVRRLIETGGEGQILLSESYAGSLGSLEGWEGQILEEEIEDQASRRYRIEPQRLFFLDSGRAEPNEVRADLESALSDDGHDTQSSQEKGIAWAKSVEARIRSADAVIAFITKDSANSDLLQYELEVAMDERRKRGRPQILPIWMQDGPTTNGPLAALNRNLHYAVWNRSDGNDKVVSEVRAALASGLAEVEPERLDTTGGAVPIDSKFYVRRPADDEFEDALLGHESIVLVKGPRQIGKTSLIGRGVELARELGWRVTSTDFQKLSGRQLDSDTDFYRVIATTLSRELGFDFDYERDWLEVLGPNLNMDGFVRSLVASSDLPLVWFIDEADRLFQAPFASDFFGLVRSWHNARATDRRGPWGRLTVVIGYATEAHLFIKDLNQSPFNVGRAVPMTMFGLESLADLNGRYGHPIKEKSDLEALHALIGGQPFLTRRALDVLSQGRMDVATLFRTADSEDGPFGDHLKRLLVSVTQLPMVWEALTRSLASPDLPDSEGLQRLVAAGILVRSSDKGYRLASELYHRFLAHYVREGGA